MEAYVIDAREPAESMNRFVRHFSKFGIVPKIASLDVGDVVVNGMCIERKTPADFIASITDGRLFEQAVKMKSYSKSLVVVEGRLGDLLNPKFRRINVNAVTGAVASLCVDFGLPVLFTDKYYDLVYYHLFNRALKTERVERIVKEKITDYDDAKVHLIASVPGVGAKRARLILEKFGTVLDAILNVDLWNEIEGIGDKTIESAKEVFYGQYNNKIQTEKSE